MRENFTFSIFREHKRRKARRFGMNTTLKHWREAATLILAAGHRLGAEALSRTPQTPAPSSPPAGSFERSSLPHKSAFDYDVLMLKRSGKSGFMPNNSVFPGGTVAPADFSSDWLDIFKAFRKSPNFGLGCVKQPLETRPPIFATDRLKLGSPVPGEVAFRICALRETFEESGVFLCVSKSEETNLLKVMEDRTANNNTLHPHVSNGLSSSDLVKWRALVNEHPSNFIRMCRELEVLPNIWALHEWANWLTPTGLNGKRFDTAFFICCLKDIPHTIQDQKEIVHFQWSTPSEILHSYLAKELVIAPPQIYELGRLCRLPLLDDLHRFVSNRATEGCEFWLPVVYANESQILTLLPGDELHPETCSDMSTSPHSEDPHAGPALHRLVAVNRHPAAIQMNITPKYNHLVPVVASAVPHSGL
ncbi:acyl-coenzyme A diphosphatase NUDT19 [Genypterus blacodes]|uniref:acyl-coenzyme A diphosphatase NUDT19 n=1 Tax=Genypterus blacodes TaxID=154954 RepID=UPI003F75866C